MQGWTKHNKKSTPDNKIIWGKLGSVYSPKKNIT